MTMEAYLTNKSNEQMGFFMDDYSVNPVYEGLQKQYVHPDTLIPGDRIRVTLRNGYTSEGIYSSKGRRINVPGETYFFERKVYFSSGKRTEINVRKYGEFQDDDKVELLMTADYPDYKLPNKDDVLKLLIKELKQVPLDARIQTYRNFCGTYPQYEENWYKLLDNVWDKAIELVTTNDEVKELVLSKKDIGRKTYEPVVKAYLDGIFENTTPGKKVKTITGFVWTKDIYIAWKDESYCSAAKFTGRGMFNGIYGNLLEVTKDKKLFYRILDNWGMIFQDSKHLNLEKDYIKIPLEDDNITIWKSNSLLNK